MGIGVGDGLEVGAAEGETYGFGCDVRQTLSISASTARSVVLRVPGQKELDNPCMDL